MSKDLVILRGSKLRVTWSDYLNDENTEIKAPTKYENDHATRNMDGNMVTMNSHDLPTTTDKRAKKNEIPSMIDNVTRQQSSTVTWLKSEWLPAKCIVHYI